MTVKELKELLNEFDDNLIVMIPNRYLEEAHQHHSVSARHVSQGANEFDGCLFIDDYAEED